MHWSSDYVGIPFAWGGSTRAGCSCWGLVCLVQEEVFGRHIPRHDEAVEAVGGGCASDPGIWQSGVRAEPVAIPEAREGDVLRMWGIVGGRRAPLHIGTFTGPRSVLHIEHGADSIIETITAPRFRWRPIQAYRLV